MPDDCLYSEFNSDCKILQSLKKKCENSNKTLLFYTNCLIKMHSAYFKIANSDLLSYVNQIMKSAFHLVILYFSEELDDYFKADNEYVKQEIIDDIENSVVEFGEMFETIVNSTNGADRILLQSAPVEIGLKYTAPKICAFYSCMLNNFAKILNPYQERGYAFCVYPALNSGSEAHIMFKNNTRHGKVCIIQIPEKCIGNIPYVRQILFHELFHILPGDMRDRKFRTEKLNKIYTISLWPFMVNGTEKFFTELESERLANWLLNDLSDCCDFNSIYLEPDYVKYYSTNVKKYYINRITEYLAPIPFIDTADFLRYLDPGNSGYNYQSFVSNQNRIINGKNIIANNILKMYYNQTIVSICNFYMLLFREPLSDLFAVLTLRSGPAEFYKHLIEDMNGMPEACDIIGERHLLYLRASFVTEILLFIDMQDKQILLSQMKFLEKWRSLSVYKELCNDHVMCKFLDFTVAVSSERMKKFFEPVLENVTWEEDNGRQSDFQAKSIQQPFEYTIDMPLSSDMREDYLEYFTRCFENFMKYEKEHEQAFVDFRKQYCLEELSECELAKYISMRQWEVKNDKFS